jgi:hypothetical protein
MPHRLITLATYWSSFEANLAKNDLESAGIRAFLADDKTVGMMWHLTNAVWGVKLQVEDCDAERALAILAEYDSMGTAAGEGAAEEKVAAEMTPAIDAPQPNEPDEADAEWSLTQREQDAERALKASLFGYLFFPLEFFALWLLLKVVASPERLGRARRRRAIVALILFLPWLAIVLLLIRGLLDTRIPFWNPSWSVFKSYGPQP